MIKFCQKGNKILENAAFNSEKIEKINDKLYPPEKGLTQQEIEELRAILASEQKVLDLIKKELLEIINNKINVVAVDGFRLALRSIYLQTKVNDFKAVIPGKTLNEISKILDKPLGTVYSIYKKAIQNIKNKICAIVYVPACTCGSYLPNAIIHPNSSMEE